VTTSERPTYQSVPKKHARYLLAKIEEFRAQQRQYSPFASESAGDYQFRVDAGALHCLLGLLQHHADPSSSIPPAPR